MKNLVIVFILIHFYSGLSANFCHLKCDCNMEELTPFVDCSSVNLTQIEWNQIPILEQKTVDIDFENNQFTQIRKVPKLPIERLSFKHNKITYIEDGSFENLVYLSFLDLSYNELSDLSREVFKGPERIGQGTPSPILYLDLSFNKIETLPRTAFEYLFHLEEINLSGNPLKIVSDQATITAVGSLTKLLYLNLSETGIDTLPSHFLKGLIKIKSIDLSRNNLDFVPKEIHYGGGASLEELILDSNPIKFIKTHAFNQMEKLKKLSICKMPELTEIHESAFSGLRNLSVLHLDENPNLSFIDPDAFVEFQDPFVLEELTLTHNFLRYLPNTLFPADFSSLKIFKINGNQWECDCHNEWLLELMNYDKYLSYARRATCTRPIKFKVETK